MNVLYLLYMYIAGYNHITVFVTAKQDKKMLFVIV